MLAMTLALALPVAPGQPVVVPPFLPFVEYDFSAVRQTPGRPVRIGFEFVTADRLPYTCDISFVDRTHDGLTEVVLEVVFREAGFVACRDEAKKRVRVFGWVGPDKKFHPAGYGRIISTGLQAHERVKVTGPPAPPLPAVVIDFATVPFVPDTPATLRFEVTAADGGRVYRDQLTYTDRPPPEDLAMILEFSLVDQGFQAKADGARVLVYGWADDKLRLRPATAGKVESKDLKPEQRPTVTNPKKGP